MTFLAIDTSGDHGVVVLADLNGTVIDSTIFEGRRTLSTQLMGTIDHLLKTHGLTINTVSGLAVGIGPGSFTGLRVGLTTMKTFAQVTGLPIVGVNTLAAYAGAAHPTGNVVVVATPSRRGEVYAAVYAPNVDPSPFASTYEALATRIGELGDNPVLLGPDATLDQIPSDAARIDVVFTPPQGLATIAARRLSAGDVDNPISLTPLYVVPPAISTPRDSSILPAENLTRALSLERGGSMSP